MSKNLKRVEEMLNNDMFCHTTAICSTRARGGLHYRDNTVVLTQVQLRDGSERERR